VNAVNEEDEGATKIKNTEDLFDLDDFGDNPDNTGGKKQPAVNPHEYIEEQTDLER